MSDRALTVRRAGVADAAAVAHVAEVTFTEAFGHLYPPEDLAVHIGGACTPEACLRNLRDPRLAYWLAGAEGEPPAGFALAGYCKLPIPNLEATAGELRQLYVRSTHQNRGLGAKIFEAALTWLESRYAPVYIGVWAENHGAQRFYGRYGFTKVGEYRFPVGKTVDREFILKR